MTEEKPDDAPDGYEMTALSDEVKDDPFLKRKRLRYVVDELQSILEDYDFNQTEEMAIEASIENIEELKER